MRIAITADLHWGHNRLGDEATGLLRRQLDSEGVDLLLLGGDIGSGEHFAGCLEVFRELRCAKAVVPGNHDLWVVDNDSRGDSQSVYERHLPGLCAQYGYHCLDHGAWVDEQADLAVVGSVNWYDYSWALERMKAEVHNWEWHLENKAFSRGRHNDGRFIRWATNDVEFTRTVVATFERQLDEALKRVGRAIVLTHHPALRGLSFPRESPAHGLDPLLWEALSGNAALESVLAGRAAAIAFVFSGHTHRDVECRLGSAVGRNIGGDYHFKRMLILDWPAGSVQAHVFGDPGRRR